jgi:hypothetical protein
MNIPDTKERFTIFARDFPHSWLTDSPILQKQRTLPYDITWDPINSFTSRFTLVVITKPNGVMDQYWHRVEIRESCPVIQASGDITPVTVTRATLILPRGPRQITGYEMTRFFQDAFKSSERQSTTHAYHGLSWVMKEVEAIKALGEMKWKLEEPIHFNGYRFYIKQISFDNNDNNDNQILFTLEKVPPYGSPESS